MGKKEGGESIGEKKWSNADYTIWGGKEVRKTISLPSFLDALKHVFGRENSPFSNLIYHKGPGRGVVVV